jgi:hypothetical protein
MGNPYASFHLTNKEINKLDDHEEIFFTEPYFFGEEKTCQNEKIQNQIKNKIKFLSKLQKKFLNCWLGGQ